MFNLQSVNQVTINHFNDVYNIDEHNVEPIGGAARFKSALQSFKTKSTLTLFSGDCLGPSLLSKFTKGKQMIPVLNGCQVDCAVVGNHDFDYGIDVLTKLIKQTNFPWLLSNVTYPDGVEIAGTKVYHVIENSGKKFGLIGLVEREWISILSTVNPDDIKYNDFVDIGRKLIYHLKYKEKVDYIIALTHMRNPNDIRLANQVPGINLILGGHDHVCQSMKVNDVFIIKSGTDFKNFSTINLNFNLDSVQLNHQLIDVTSKFTQDEQLKGQLECFKLNIDQQLDNIIGFTNCPLDGRFMSIRRQETNLGNLIADIMCSSVRADCAIIHSGTFRSDQIHEPGPIHLKDLINILPTPGTMVLISVSGTTIWRALENGVSLWPRLEGRFPQVSGLRFSFDPKKPSGDRIDPQSLTINGQQLKLTGKYRLITKLFLYKGNDGYDCLKNCQQLISPDDCPEMITAIENYFQSQFNLSAHNQCNSIYLNYDNLTVRVIESITENRINILTQKNQF
ncbi:trifunctional nucleotide phosphoesterase protein YfkN-like [Panonychus citri]|uniref:trifunctional nucleotide phosphoesterase protein YfkN-like n=1 Tax=Panonychus citri TaxID=50023 RepID=UPI002307CF9F|nr:trifunctional nucleotide phosphoesterase protein YfkN-like [Panonychus citri]